jgi:TolA-binding protein
MARDAANEDRRIHCPIVTCGRETSIRARTCADCGTDLRAYALALALPDLCYNRALAWALDGRYASAERELQTCLRFRPKDEEAQLLYGQTRLALGAREEARGIFQELSRSAATPELRARAAACVAWTRVKDSPPRPSEGDRKRGRRSRSVGKPPKAQ